MKGIGLIPWLLIGLVGATYAQNSGSILSKKENREAFQGQSHIEIDLGQRNTLLLGFDNFAHVRAHQNLDSALRLFLTDYQKVADTTRELTEAVHAHFRIGETDRALDLRTYPQRTASFLFKESEEPIQLKTKQDTLHISWREADSFQAYFLVNNLADLNRIVQQGGVNARVQKAIQAAESYNKQTYSLTRPGIAFDLIQREGKEPEVINPGLAKRPVLVISPNIGVGLIKTQWTPSLAIDFAFVPNQYRRIGYSVGYLSNFAFNGAGRMDFVNVGLTFYEPQSNKQINSYNRVLAGIYLGASVYSSQRFGGPSTFRLSGTVYHKGLFKVHPELYVKGAFKSVYPGLRLSVGL
ncbi:hypothetical protein [Tellurirhabdus bombi]|uniref:hypothetical protein n=1 Tax=Tellurirhabdus bombi TaxID=2907205 RepID=UPI001F46EED3|nr:hypothetical protein [Tellurirhabdus bombi]